MNTILELDQRTLTGAGGLWTAREIAQQPASWLRTRELLERHAPRIARFLDPLLAKQDLRIILTGAGSSAFIGECLAPLLLSRLGRRVEAIATTDLLSGPLEYFQPDVPTLLVSFGRSGSSPESIAVVDLAERLLRQCHQLVFTCNEHGTLYERCRERGNSLAILLPPETHDQSFAMTSSFTAMMLAASLVFQRASPAAPRVEEISRAAQALLARHNGRLRTLAASGYSRVVYLGSNGFKALAREAALKLLELTDGKVVSAYDSPLGFRHGPKTIVTPDTLCSCSSRMIPIRAATISICCANCARRRARDGSSRSPPRSRTRSRAANICRSTSPSTPRTRNSAFRTSFARSSTRFTARCISATGPISPTIPAP
jgi:tagatose-6-phosphate ketose/aldose isomerase